LLRCGDVFFDKGQDFRGDGTAAGIGAAAERLLKIAGDVFDV